MTTVVNRYLEACVHYEEQRMAQGQSAGKTLEAVLAQAILPGEQARGPCMTGRGSDDPGAASPS